MHDDDKLLKYYISHSDKRFDALEEKVDKLISFRWMLVGASMGISGIISIAFQVIQFIYKGDK